MSSEILKNISPKKIIKSERLNLKENRKKFFFILKIILLIVLIIIQQQYYQSFYGPYFNADSLQVISYYLLSNVIITTLRFVLVNLYLKRNQFKADYKDNFIVGIDRITSLLSFIFLAIAILHLSKLRPENLIEKISLVAVALVLIFKDYISNLINGMIMMFSDQYQLNDYVKVGDFKGRIINITLSYMQIKSDEGEIYYVPNNQIFLKDIVNYSKNNTSVVVVDFDLNLKFFGVIEQLEAYIIQKTSSQFNAHVKAESVMLKVEKIKKEEAVIKLVLTLNKQNRRLERIIHRYCNFTIMEFLGKELSNLGIVSNVKQIKDDEA